MDLDGLQRLFFDGLYTYRIALLAASAIVIVGGLVVARRMGWLAAIRRYPVRTGALVVLTLAVVGPAGWYLASPLWIRTELVEAVPVAVSDQAGASFAGPAGAAASRPASAPPLASTPTDADMPTVAPRATPFVARRIAGGTFQGTDDFHYGRGSASIIETAPGVHVLRLEAFSVRNGPDLFVYLSPVGDDYADGALELGRLKATDGAFSYQLPAGTDPSDFASAVIWCKQFSHLFAVAPLSAI